MADKLDTKKATSLGQAVQNQSRRADVNGEELDFHSNLTLHKEPMRHLRTFHLFFLFKGSCRLNDPPLDLNELFTIPISE